MITQVPGKTNPHQRTKMKKKLFFGNLFWHYALATFAIFVLSRFRGILVHSGQYKTIQIRLLYITSTTTTQARRRLEGNTHQEVVHGHMLMKYAVVDGCQCVGAGEAESEDTEVPL